MTPRFRFRPAAEKDVDEQADYLAREAGLERAFRYYDQVFATLEAIGERPGLGEWWVSRDTRLAGVRVRRVDGFARHLIFDLDTSQGIDVIRVLHGARDIDRILDGDADEE